jgi:hypothetical protein
LQAILHLFHALLEGERLGPRTFMSRIIVREGTDHTSAMASYCIKPVGAMRQIDS